MDANLPFSAAPVRQKERIFLIDAIRGVAILGILLMNIPYFGMPEQVADSLAVRSEFSGPNFWSWAIVSGGFEGTMRGLFSLLFGASSLLLLNRLEARLPGTQPTDIYFRRLLWMLVFGVINAFIFLWPGDILYAYALCGMLLFPFRNLSPRALLIAAFVVLLIATYKENRQVYDRREVKRKGEVALALEKKKAKLTDEQKDEMGAWKGLQERTKVEAQRKEAAKAAKKIQGSYADVYKAYEALNIRFESIAIHQYMVWDITLFILLGMALFKTGVLTGQRPTSTYWALLLVGYGVGLTLNYLAMRFQYQIRFDSIRALDWLFQYYEIRRVFHTLGHVGLLVLLYRSGVFDGFFRLMAPVGQMAFSNYLLQSIICSLIFYGYGLGLFNRLQRYELYVVVAGVWAFEIVLSHVWLRYFQFGPFEWLWRSLTYWKRQPLRREQPVPSEEALGMA